MLDMVLDHLVDIFPFLFCVVISSFFSASETAITSLGNLKTKHLIDTLGDKKSKHLKLWLDHPGRVLSTILVFNNAVNILASALATQIAFELFDSFPVGIATGFTTFWILIFGEIIPKSFAKANAEALGVVSLKIIRILYLPLTPVVWCLSEFAALIIRSLGGQDTSLKPTITEEELEFLINESESAGVIENFKKDMLAGVFEFDETKVREIMTPRPDIEGIAKTATIDDAVKLTIRTGHSRIPVYEETIDRIVGLVLAKDLLRIQGQGEHVRTEKISDIMREPFFVPESRLIMDCFKDLKRTKNHMAIVIDEHGGTAGLVTMEDILEEIVGEIQDEFDVEEAKILEIEHNSYDVAGSVNIQEFISHFELDDTVLTEDVRDVDTIGGVLTHLVGTMPQVGLKADLGPLDLEITEVDRHRIERIRVMRHAPSEPEEQEVAES